MALPQPNFPRISEGFVLLAQGFQLLDNLPAVAQGNQLLHALNEINHNITALRGDIQRLETKLDTA